MRHLLPEFNPPIYCYVGGKLRFTVWVYASVSVCVLCFWMHFSFSELIFRLAFAPHTRARAHTHTNTLTHTHTHTHMHILCHVLTQTHTFTNTYSCVNCRSSQGASKGSFHASCHMTPPFSFTHSMHTHTRTHTHTHTRTHTCTHAHTRTPPVM